MDVGAAEVLHAATDVAAGELEFAPEGLEPLEVLVDGTDANGAPARERDPGVPTPRQQRPEREDARPHLAHEVVGASEKAMREVSIRTRWPKVWASGSGTREGQPIRPRRDRVVEMSTRSGPARSVLTRGEQRGDEDGSAAFFAPLAGMISRRRAAGDDELVHEGVSEAEVGGGPGCGGIRGPTRGSRRGARPRQEPWWGSTALASEA